MAAVSIQAQVESVLSALLKVASVELTRLFESRYRVSAVDAGGAEDSGRTGTVESVWTKRSVGVQVDVDSCPQADLSGTVLNGVTSCFHQRLICYVNCLRVSGFHCRIYDTLRSYLDLV